MITLQTPRGLPVNVPESEQEDPSPKFKISELDDAKRYYKEKGYCVIREVVRSSVCDTLKSLWATEVKPSSSFIYRQATAKAERHEKNDKGWVMNPILNLQSVDPREFREFRRFSTSELLANPLLSDVLRKILDEDPVVVQSMYFEGNSATWEHQDSYYLDSEKIGSMVGAWIAMEDIEADAGRFFVCAESQKIDLGLQRSTNNIVDHHDEYIESVVSVIQEKCLQIRAPVLNTGDVLLWNARTIHGSLDSFNMDRTRQSVTLHAIPATHRFLQHQHRIVPLKLKNINGISIHHPKDLAQMMPKVIHLFESTFPKQFYTLKSFIVKALIPSR